MHLAMQRNANSRCKKGDTIVHIGDWCTRGKARGVEGMRWKAEMYEDFYEAKIIHIRGNHDGNNGVKHAFEYATVAMGGFKFFVIHKPPYRKEEIPIDCDAVLCGHVHEKWSHIWVDDIPVINLGVDQHRFMPKFDDEVIGLYTHLMREKEGSNEPEHSLLAPGGPDCFIAEHI